MSRDRAMALQPGQQEQNSVSKKKKEKKEKLSLQNAAIKCMRILFLKHGHERLFLFLFSNEHLKIQFNQKIFIG